MASPQLPPARIGHRPTQSTSPMSRRLFLLSVSILVYVSAPSIRAATLWEAIAQVESGANDRVIGTAGERSRYQIRPRTWRPYSQSRHYADPVLAAGVAQKHLDWLRQQFRKTRRFEPSDLDLAIAWQLGFEGYKRKGFDPSRLTPAARDRAQRILNLTQP